MEPQIFKNRFYDYVDLYREDGKLCKLLQEKLEHIERVADDSVYIAKGEGWSDKDVSTAEICGFYHDVGRFSQYKQYGTFSDGKSVNHGQHGFEVINTENMFKGMEKSISQAILDAVRYHNALDIPNGLGAESVRFTKLVRDADKIDIFFQLTDAIENNTLDNHRDLLWDFPIGEPNPVIVEKLLNNSQALYSEIKNGTDVCLLQLCWLYGMNYKSTFKKLIENKTVELLERIMPKTAIIEKCVKHINEFLESQAAEG